MQIQNVDINVIQQTILNVLNSVWRDEISMFATKNYTFETIVYRKIKEWR